jgi:hypothetical protein
MVGCFDFGQRLIELPAAVAHRKRQLTRESKNGASLSKTAIAKPCGFRGLCCLALFATTALLRVRPKQRQPHRLQSFRQIVMF